MTPALPPGLSIFLYSYSRPGTRPAGAVDTATITTTIPVPVSMQVAAPPKPSTLSTMFWSALALAASGFCAYHGAKRHNGSWGWGFGWGVGGAMFPVITPVIAVAQGYAKPIRG